MKLTVKTLKGGKFVVDADASSTVAEVKAIIEGVKSELPAANMKLIHSGKVLKDDSSIESCNIKPNDFLVCMITKAKKAAPAAAKSTTAPTPAPAPAPEKKEEKSSTAPAPATSTDASAAAVSTTASGESSPSAPAPAPSDEFPAEVVGNLTAMGFPEAEVRACLRAAQGNPDVAVEFLMNGIPASVASASLSTGGTGTTPQSGVPLQALRSHPQFNDLRRLVQNNPQMLQSVLTQIGQQQPELLREINENQAAFLEMMNEPVPDSPAPTPAPASAPAPAPASAASGSGAGGGAAASMLAGMADPTQMAQMLSNLSPNELNEMAAMMGLTPQQLQATAQMIGQMPPEQFQEYMMQAMQQGGGIPGLSGAGGGGAPGGLGGGGPTFLRLTEEEMASVDRLVDMGFDRAEAAQAFLACDKNEALAANLLMDSAGDGGFGFGGGGGDGPGDGSGSSNGGDGANGGGNDDSEDMYD